MPRSPRNSPRVTKGFTLIEFIMVAVIISILSVVVGRFLIQAYTSFVTANNIGEVNQQAAIALARLTNDIHNIRSAADITTMTSNALSFTDVNGNSIQYTVSGATLLRSSIILIDNLSSITFSYYTASGATTASATTLAYITIALTTVNGTVTQTFTTAAGKRHT